MQSAENMSSGEGVERGGEGAERGGEGAERLAPPAAQCGYTACYCEENVWRLCEQVRRQHAAALSHTHAVFISNHHKTIPIWRQSSSKQKEGLVVWDYHVILVAKHVSSGRHFVYDLDTTLPFPCDFDAYFRDAIRADDTLLPQYRRLFRVIAAAEFLADFASDRSHMLKEDGVTYLATPPDYPPIKSNLSDNNIRDFISMETHIKHGSVLDSQQLWLRFRNS